MGDKRWYAVHTYSGFENKAKKSLEEKIRMEGLEEHFGDKVYRTLVPRNVRLAEAPSFGAPAVVWDKASKGAAAYLSLTDEVLSRTGLPQAAQPAEQA